MPVTIHTLEANPPQARPQHHSNHSNASITNHCVTSGASGYDRAAVRAAPSVLTRDGVRACVFAIVSHLVQACVRAAYERACGVGVVPRL